MLQTYIKNRGTTKTIFHNNNNNKVNEINWDADYDGNVANLSLDLNNNGCHNKYHFELDKDDLANILNINSINLPLDQRLKRDFKKTFRKKPKIYQIQFDNVENIYHSRYISCIYSTNTTFSLPYIIPILILPLHPPLGIFLVYIPPILPFLYLI